MRGNIVVAAAVFGLAMVVSSAVLILGARWALNGAADRLGQTIQEHGRSVERAGTLAGAPIQGGLKEMAAGVDRLGQSVEGAGDKISHPQLPAEYNVKLQGPVAVQQPLIIRGAAEDGALPVNARIGK